MSEQREGLDFATVIASTVHDLKNSLSILTRTHNQWVERLPVGQRDDPALAVIEQECLHLNARLVQLLGLYKLGVQRLPVCPDYHELDDFLDAQLAPLHALARQRGIHLSGQVTAPDALGFFDRELVSSAIGTVLDNAVRHARSAVQLSVHSQRRSSGRWCVISVNDDGPGFAPHWLECPQGSTERPVSSDPQTPSSSTGLGLYFAARIAALHVQSGRRGYTEHANGGELKGALFQLWLP